MEIAAAFLLVIVLIVVAVLGGGLYLLTMWLRHKQLDPEEDKIEGEPRRRPRPEHVEVESEQNARFVDTR
jgi:hypothetical protein